MSEPPAKTGSSDRAQIYGEICLEYRPDIAHGKITGLATPDRREWCVKFTSTRYKQLVIPDLGVTFVDGETEVTDKTAIEALRGLPSVLGVRAVGGRPSRAGKDDRTETSTE
ncbi:SU10 major capsid protein [Saccharothrix isguenensis]